MARTKAAAVDTPKSKAEALEMIAEYALCERGILLEKLAAAETIDQVKQDRDSNIAKLEAQRKPLFAGLQAWWEAGGAKEVAGTNRSAMFGAIKLGIRKTPPAVKFARKVKEAAVLAWLGSLRWTRKSEFMRRGKISWISQR